MSSSPPPTRDFLGPFLFIAVFVGVALTAVGLLVYAVTMESRDRFETFDLDGNTSTSPGDEIGLADAASIWVDGAPYGATLLVNADSVGTMPMTIEDLPAGDYLLTLQADGLEMDTLVSVEAGQTAAVFLRLGGLGDVSGVGVDVEPDVSFGDRAPLPQPPLDTTPSATLSPVSTTGMLRVVSQPAGATVRIDGVPLGTTPLALPDVEAGRHIVALSLAGHEPRETSVDVAAGRDQMIRLSLAAVAGPGTLQIIARPWGTIYIDGVLHKRNTDVVYRAELPAGTHEIRVVHPTFGTRTRQVTVPMGQSVMEVFDLTVGSTDGGS